MSRRDNPPSRPAPPGGADRVSVAQAVQLAAAAYARQDFAEAERLCRLVLQAQPGHFGALHLLGVIAAQTRRLDMAVELLSRATLADPGNPDAQYNLGNALRAAGRHADALARYDRALSIRPHYADAHFNRGNALSDLGRHEEARSAYDRALAIAPAHAVAWNNRGNALRALGDSAQALDSYDRALAIAPECADAHVNRGNALTDLRRHAEALDAYDRALRLAPSARAYNNRANALRELDRPAESLASCDRALQLGADFPEAHHNRGNALQDLARHEEALASYDRALGLRPGFAEAHNSRGISLQVLRRYEEAIAAYDRALALKTGYADAINNRGSALRELRRYTEAAEAFSQLVRLAPGYDFAKGELLHTKMLCCDWTGLDELHEAIRADLRAGRRSAEPFGFQAISESAGELRACAEIYAAAKYPARQDLPARPARPPRDRIRVGYVSGEFRNQATAILITELFELHDRERFEISAFDNGWDDGSELRRRIDAAVGGIVDIAHLGDLQAASLIQEAGIDVLVNLNGYFGFGRQGVFALRPSPIQVNYLGFPGTLGAGYMDYLVADATVIPAEDREFYTERIACLPHCYQVNDSKRRISGRAFARQELGLPDGAFVFCCFNNNYKIAPPVFDSWMRVLQRVEHGVLWLYENSPAAADNLRREARARGVDPARLVFAQAAPHDEHLARLRAADLVVDTLPYNAHTTASDALWAGVPVLTRIGSTFPGRVAASLLKAIGLPELVTSTREEYEALAISLATDAARLAELRARLARNRLSMPLYDTRRYARHLEAAYAAMVERHRSGLGPEHLTVPD